MEAGSSENRAGGVPVVASVAQGVDIGKLEKELRRQWEEAAKNDTAGVARACVLNLIVYATADEDRAEIDGALDEVSEQNPCRAIIVVADRESQEPKLSASVSLRCSRQGARQVCGEQITVETGGTNLESVSSAVAPLLVSDVPVFLWWRDIPHYKDPLFNHLVEMSDRLVIDSATFDHPREDLLRLAEMIQKDSKNVLVSDVNWGRLTSWRTLIASFWDVPDYRPHLERIERVTIEYEPNAAAPEEPSPQAALVVGWLASRLGWDVSGGKPQVELRRAPDGEAGKRGMISSLTLISEGGAAEFFVAVNRDGSTLETSAKIGEEHSVGRVLAYEAKSEGQRLSRELALLGRDTVYENAVKVAAKIIAQRDGGGIL